MSGFWKSLPRPSRMLEQRFYPEPGSSELIDERLHYENLKQLTDKQLDVIRYLYMRLNIIDGKASYLLRINTLTASVISLLISFSARADGESIFSRIDWWQNGLLGLTLIAIAVAFVLAFAIGELEYDHVTEPPTHFNQVDIGPAFDPKESRYAPEKRLFRGNYSDAEAAEILSVLRSGKAEVHSLKAYEDEFFKITIARIRILHWARAWVLVGVVSSMAFVIGFAAAPPVPKPQPVQQIGALPAAPAPVAPPPVPVVPPASPAPALPSAPPGGAAGPQPPPVPPAPPSPQQPAPTAPKTPAIPSQQPKTGP